MLSIKGKILNVFHMSVLNQDTTRKEQVDKALLEPEMNLEFETDSNKGYEVDAIIDSVV